MKVDHDAKPGPLDRCQVCGSQELLEVIDLGHQPLYNTLLRSHELREPEVHYPLRLMQCANCSLAQLDYVVPAQEVYPLDYPYRAGLSWPVVAAHREMAKRIVERFGSTIVAVERSPYMLDAARERAEWTGALAKLHLDDRDIRAFRADPETFHLSVMLGDWLLATLAMIGGSVRPSLVPA